jgi:hypothetical protein
LKYRCAFPDRPASSIRIASRQILLRTLEPKRRRLIQGRRAVSNLPFIAQDPRNTPAKVNSTALPHSAINRL